MLDLDETRQDDLRTVQGPCPRYVRPAGSAFEVDIACDAAITGNGTTFSFLASRVMASLIGGA